MKKSQKITAAILTVLVISFSGCKSAAVEELRFSDKETEVQDASASAEKYEENGTKNKKEEMKEIEEKRLPRSVILDVEAIYQEPELPTGCESVALTMLLQYEGFELDKTTIAEEYLIYSENWNFDEGYVGDPASYEGAGCFPPTLVKTAQAYLDEQESSINPVDLTGKSMEELLHYVACGHPVAVWTSMYMEMPVLIEQEDSAFPWYDTEHCVVLSGYDLEEGILTVQDPLMGTIKREKEALEEIYNIIGQYAIVLL